MTTLVRLVAAGVVVVTARSLGGAWYESLQYAAAAIVLIGAVNDLTLRWRAGGVLLDLGPSRERVGGLIVAPLMLAVAVREFTTNNLPDAAVLSAIAIAFVMAAVTRRQIREVGIRLDWSFTPWRNVASWQVVDQETVRLKCKGSLWAKNLRVPAARQAELLQLLEERAAVTPSVSHVN